MFRQIVVGRRAEIGSADRRRNKRTDRRPGKQAGSGADTQAQKETGRQAHIKV